MRVLTIIITVGLTILFAGCSEPREPISFYLSSQKPTSGNATIPTNPPVLVVRSLQFVAPDSNQHTITIKFSPADASAIEKLTTANIGKTVVVVQGSGVLSAAVVSAPVPPNAGLMIPISTNLDFERVYRAIARLQ